MQRIELPMVINGQPYYFAYVPKPLTDRKSELIPHGDFIVGFCNDTYEALTFLVTIGAHQELVPVFPKTVSPFFCNQYPILTIALGCETLAIQKVGSEQRKEILVIYGFITNDDEWHLHTTSMHTFSVYDTSFTFHRGMLIKIQLAVR